MRIMLETNCLPLIHAYHDYPEGVKKEIEKKIEKRSIPFDVCATAFFSFSSSVVASLFANWLYEKIKDNPKHYCWHFQCEGWHPEKYSEIANLNTWNELRKEIRLSISEKLHHIVDLIKGEDFNSVMSRMTNVMAEQISMEIDKQYINLILGKE